MMLGEQMKILQLGKFYPIQGGVEKVMYDLTTGLSEFGDGEIACDMMCAVTEGEGREIRLNGKARLLGCRTWKKVCATTIAPSMIVLLRKTCHAYDIIHVHHPDPMAALALFLSGYKGKVVLHWHADIQKQRALLSFYRPLQEWLLRRADLILGTTPTYLAESPHLKDVQEKVHCLPIGIDRVVPSPETVIGIQQRYPGKKIIFSLGRLVGYKGYAYLVEAAAHLDDDFIVLIGGSGPMAGELAALVRDRGLQDKVKFLGRISDEELPSYYGACKLFCLSSVLKTEAFGIVQIESMSCGKPVVATNIPQSGVSWVNAHGVSGLNVEPRNARQLAEAIRQIASDEKTYAAYSRQARQRYETFFTKERMIRQCVSIYTSLYGKNENRSNVR